MAKFEASIPIYKQILDQICYEIVRGDIKPGDKLSSVREMAIEKGVNPNTIQRTYSELERMEIVVTKRGQGTFVTENEERIFQLKKDLQIEMIKQFVSNMHELGFSNKEILDGLATFMKEGGSH